MSNNENLGYPNVVVDNFFLYLSQKGISQKKYASDNNLDATILSKWKKEYSSPTLDQIIQAAKYFEITVNDLVYSEKEKRYLEVFVDKSYDPIIAQQSIKVKLFEDFFKKPFKVLALCFVLFVFFFVITYLMLRVSAFYSLLLILAIPFVVKVIRASSFREKTYIINYLDDIFYRRNESNFKFYYGSLAIRVLSLLMIFYYFSLFMNFDSTNSMQTPYFITLLFLLMILLVSSFTVIFSLPRRFKLEIYDHETEAYNSSRLFLITHFALLSIAILFCINDFHTFYLFGIISLVILCMNAVDYVVFSKEYAKYVLIYQENEKEPRELFPKF